MDFTTLGGDNTPGNVQRLCTNARQPVREDMLAELDMHNENLTLPKQVRDRFSKGERRSGSRL